MPDDLAGPLEVPAIAHFTSCDLDQCRFELNRFYYPVTMGARDAESGFRFDMEVIQLGPLTVGDLGYRGSVTLTAEELGAYHVTIPTTGPMLSRHAGHEV